MTFQQGTDPKTGQRAKRVAIYEMMRATPGRVWTPKELREVLEVRHPDQTFSRSIVNTTLGAFVQSRNAIGAYPFIHKVADGQYTYDEFRAREIVRPRKTKRRKQVRRETAAVPVEKGAVRAQAAPRVTVDSDAIVLVVDGKRMIAYPA